VAQFLDMRVNQRFLLQQGRCDASRISIQGNMLHQFLSSNCSASASFGLLTEFDKLNDSVEGDQGKHGLAGHPFSVLIS
jgi:hypothetical protein